MNLGLAWGGEKTHLIDILIRQAATGMPPPVSSKLPCYIRFTSTLINMTSQLCSGVVSLCGCRQCGDIMEVHYVSSLKTENKTHSHFIYSEPDDGGSMYPRTVSKISHIQCCNQRIALTTNIIANNLTVFPKQYMMSNWTEQN
jgi:hypothetical protein